MATAAPERIYSDGGVDDYIPAMFAHLPLALVLQFLGYAVGRGFDTTRVAAIWTGAFASGLACVMREVTQAEYRWIEGHGGLRRAMPEYQGLAVWQWNAHSLAETGVAIVAVVAVAAVVTLVDSRAGQSRAGARVDSVHRRP